MYATPAPFLAEPVVLNSRNTLTSSGPGHLSQFPLILCSGAELLQFPLRLLLLKNPCICFCSLLLGHSSRVALWWYWQWLGSYIQP